MPSHTMVRNPAIFAIVTSQPVLHNKRFAGIECLRVNLETPLQIVRMHAFDPSISDFLLQATAGKLEPRLVKKSAEFIQARHPDKHRRRVGHDPETLLASPQGRFAPSTIRNIANNTDEATLACDGQRI